MSNCTNILQLCLHEIPPFFFNFILLKALKAIIPHTAHIHTIITLILLPLVLLPSFLFLILSLVDSFIFIIRQQLQSRRGLCLTCLNINSSYVVIFNHYHLILIFQFIKRQLNLESFYVHIHFIYHYIFNVLHVQSLDADKSCQVAINIKMKY